MSLHWCSLQVGLTISFRHRNPTCFRAGARQVGLMISFCADKVIALRFTRKPPQLSDDVVLMLFHIMRLLPLGQTLLTWYLYYNLDCSGAIEEEDNAVCVNKRKNVNLVHAVHLLIWAAFALLPIGWWVGWVVVGLQQIPLRGVNCTGHFLGRSQLVAAEIALRCQ